MENQGTSANMLDNITQFDMMVAVSVALTFAAIAGILNYRKSGDSVKAIGMTTHVTVWQASSGANMLFWFILGSSMESVSAFLLPLIFFGGDVAKVIIPRTMDYRVNIGKRIIVNFLRTVSIFATVGLGTMYATHNANKNLDAELADKEASLVVKAAEATTQAAETKLEAGTPDENYLARQEKLNRAIRELEIRPAVDFRGNTLYWQGKKNPPTTVLTATKGCRAGNSYTKIPQNRCDELVRLRTSSDKLSSDLSVRANNADNTAKAYQQAGEQVAEARRVLEGTPPALPVDQMIVTIMNFFGVSQEFSNNKDNISLVFGAFLGISLEMLVVVTMIRDLTNEEIKRLLDPKNNKTSLMGFRDGIRALRKIAKITGILRDKRGTSMGQSGDKARTNAGQVHPAPPNEVEIFSGVTLDKLDGLLDASLVGEADGISLKEGHNTVLVLLMQHYGKAVPTGAFHKLCKQRFGQGVSKDYIGHAKLILHRNGYMNAAPHGTRGIKYEWVDEETLNAVVQQHLDGSYRYQPATPTHESTPKAPIVTIEALRQRKNQMNFNPDGGLTAA